MIPITSYTPPTRITTKQQVVKVYNAAGQFLDVWRDCSFLGDQNASNGVSAPKFAVNTVTQQITATLPRSWDNFDEAGDSRGRGTVGAGNVVQFWVYDNGTLTAGRLVYQGYIDGYEPAIDDADNETVQVTITPFDTILGDVKYIGTTNFGTAGSPGTYVDPVTMFNWPFGNNDPVTGHPYPNPLTLDPANPASSGTTYQLQFHNQSLAEFFEAVRTIAPANWFWRFNHDTKTVTFKQASTTPDHTFIVGKHINQPQYQKDYTTLKNDIYVVGTGVTARATGADTSIYGRRTLVIVEPRLIDATTATRYANAVLAEQDVVQYRSTITVVDNRGDASGLGYDIETIKVGQTCRIADPYHNAGTTLWDQAVWDTDVWDFSSGAQINQTVTIAGLTYQWDCVQLELAILQPSQDRFLLNLALQYAASQFN